MATVCKKTYVKADGSETRSATPEAEAIRFAFENGSTHDVKLDSFDNTILQAAAAHGLGAKLGDSFASSGGDPAAAEAMFSKVLAQLQGDEKAKIAPAWVAISEGGSRTTVLAEALAQVKPEKYATVVEAQAEIATWDKEKVAGARKLLSVTMAEITAKRAAEKAKKAKKGAGETDGDALASL